MTRTKLISLISIFVLACLATPSSHAQICSTHSLKGSYGYTVTGSIVTPFGPLTAGPFAAVGRIVFDGAGHVTTVRSLSDDGNVLQGDAGTGIYIVNSDCTGSFNITVGPPGNVTTLTLNTVLDENYELRGLVTNQGAVLVFGGRKQLPIVY